MFSFLKKKPKHSVGLDIQPDAIRLTRIQRAKSGFILEDFASVTLPSEAILNGKIKQFRLVQSLVTQLVKKTKSQGCCAAIALPSQSVLSQRIKMSAALRPLEREAEIAANLTHYFPAVTEDLHFDFVEMDAGFSEVQEVLLVGASSEQVNTYLTIAEQAGLSVKIVDVDSYAKQRFVAETIEFQQLQIASSLNTQQWQQVATQFSVSCGLAMRSLPVW